MRRVTLFPTIALAFLSQAAVAGGGFYEINEACADVGCFPGDDPGTETVEIDASNGGQSHASYKLTGNLRYTGTNAAIVFRNGGGGVLDLNGFRILCGGTTDCFNNATNGIAMTSNAGSVTVRNGMVSQFRDGIHQEDGASSLVVEDVELFLNRDDGVQMHTGKVRDCVLRDNEFGAFFRNSEGVLFENNLIDDRDGSQDPIIDGSGDVAFGGNVITGGNDDTVIGGVTEIAPNVCGTGPCGATAKRATPETKE